ncbi:MAG: S8 family serine peptidase, partial [Bacteroidota bacterium]|nr:S8 family serine peptidase [Bacteroidota bacterium]
VSQVFSGILTNAPAYVQDYGMVVTNNSYGAIVGDCNYNGLYDLYSRILDQQAFDLPNLEHVFAVGNSGLMNCPPYPSGFKTVIGGYQTAKNVLTVGNTYGIDPLQGVLNFFSSQGPAQDGRIKPEIVAQGMSVISTANSAPYGSSSGTSMSSPAVAGGLGLLYQRYRQLNSGANPKSALMKALICNGGRDLGNNGPDYSYGFGWMNLLRSVSMLENNWYFNSTLSNLTNKTHTITIPFIPEGTAQLKVMLYWHDPAAAVFASRALVNDLDLEVTLPSATIKLPRLLDTIPANVTNVAGTNADHINNIEQIIINNPIAGNYTITVKGTSITQNSPQEYFVVYDIIPNSTTLTYPVGGEGLVPGETISINWDSYGDPSNTFTVRYSTDNGSSWFDINTNVVANLRNLNWVVPAISTDQAKITVLKNGTPISGMSSSFTIIGAPTVSLSPTQCEGYFSINWTAVTGATDYEIMMLRGDEMVSVATTTSTTYLFSGLSKDTTYWVSIRARVNDKPGRRAGAISRLPNNGSCWGSISDNDLKIDALLSPTSGRKFTSTALAATTTIKIRIKNLDDVVSNTPFDVSYSINGGLPVTETIAPTIAAGGTYDHSFTTTADLSAVAAYNLVVSVNKTGDVAGENNSWSKTIKQLGNPAINLTTTFLDDIESATIQSYNTSQIGLQGLDRYDFSNTVPGIGRIRSFINTGIAYSGSKALTLDAERYYAAGNTNYLDGTFNLAAYNGAIDDIRLDFRYKQHNQTSNANNKVWIRGSDADAWINIYDLYANQETPGNYKLSPSIEVADILAANSQTLTSSFQVRWGQNGIILAADNDGGAGYTFDDIRLYKVFDDIQMISIDTPISASCGLNAAVPVRITVRNSANTSINNIPVRYRVDGGAFTTEVIPLIAGNATIQYTFTATANFSATGMHT